MIAARWPAARGDLLVGEIAGGTEDDEGVGKWIWMRGVLNFDRFFRTGPRWTIVERDPVVALQCGGRGWMTDAL